jgi:hypothetical protein
MEAQVVILGRQHSETKKKFASAAPVLNRYLAQIALQDQHKKLSVCFVLESAQNDIIGFYTLSATGIDAKQLVNEHLLTFQTHWDLAKNYLLMRSNGVQNKLNKSVLVLYLSSQKTE